MKLTLGLPKGSLEESTFVLFKQAGFNINASSRSYYPQIDDPELSTILIRAQEMSRYVEQGIIDFGLTGLDWVYENNSNVKIVTELTYSKASLNLVRWVLAVPEESNIKSVRDLKGKRIATELVETTKRYLKKNRVKAFVEFSWGATEVKPPKLADAIVEATETGNSLRANKLKIIDTIIESSPVLIANKKTWMNTLKRQKIENVAILLTSALLARTMVGLKMNVPLKKLDNVTKGLPALNNPTISPLKTNGWVAVETVIQESTVREIVPKLKRAGAEGIVEYPLNKVIL